MRIRPQLLLPCLASLPLAALLSGCAATTIASPDAETGFMIRGNVHGGQQPVVGAHVYLLQANTTGYGAASVSTLVPTSTGLSDSTGAYVTTDGTGSFTITGDYTCVANDQYYLYAHGGNPGAGTNSAAGFLAALGSCPSNGTFATTTPFVYINEVSTVATAYAIAGFAVDATHVSSSGTTLAQTDIANAFLNVPNLVSLSTGVANTTTPAGNGTAPQAMVNTIANILASCVNSTGPSSAACTTLFSNARANGSTGTLPTDTATAAINIAHNPGANVAALYGIAAPAAAFAPAVSTQPNDYILGINYSGVGVTGSGLNGAYSIAIDGQGNAWFTNVNNNSISKLASTGAPESPATGFTSGSQFIPTGIAIDTANNAWVVDAGNNLEKYTNAGVPLTPGGGYTGGGLMSPQAVAIDGKSNNNVWAVNFVNSSASLFSSAGVAQSPSTGFTGGGTNAPTGVAIDRYGYPWITNQKPGSGSVSKLNTNGSPISSPVGYIGGGINDPFSVAIDSANNVWVANYAGNSITKLDTNGNAVSGSSGYTGGGVSNPYYLAVDGAGNVWTANYGNSTVSEFNNNGTAISPSTGFGVGGLSRPQAIEIDGSGDVWVTNYSVSSSTVNAVTELIGAAVPRVTPLSVAVQNATLGTRP